MSAPEDFTLLTRADLLRVIAEQQGQIAELTATVETLRAEVDANADVNLFRQLLLSIVSTKLRLNTLGALHSINHRREVYQEGIPDGFDDMAVMFSRGLLDHLVMEVQQPPHAAFIGAHLTTKAHDVGEHDGRQLTRLSESRAGAVLWHGDDYRASNVRLSNRQGACRCPSPPIRCSVKAERGDMHASQAIRKCPRCAAQAARSWVDKEGGILLLMLISSSGRVE